MSGILFPFWINSPCAEPYWYWYWYCIAPHKNPSQVEYWTLLSVIPRLSFGLATAGELQQKLAARQPEKSGPHPITPGWLASTLPHLHTELARAIV